MTRSLGLTDCRIYPRGTPVSLAEGDSVEKHKLPGVDMTSTQPDSSKETRRRSTSFDNFPPGKHTQLMAVCPANVANPRVNSEILSSPVGPADSGYPSNIGTQRDLPSFFTRNKNLLDWDVRIVSVNHSVVKLFDPVPCNANAHSLHTYDEIRIASRSTTHICRQGRALR